MERILLVGWVLVTWGLLVVVLRVKPKDNNEVCFVLLVVLASFPCLYLFVVVLLLVTVVRICGALRFGCCRGRMC